MKPKYPQVKVKLIGRDGNAFAILGAVQRAVREAKLSKEVFSEYSEEATSGDYNHLLATTMRWFEVD